MQTKVSRDFGSSDTPWQHHFEDRWSLKTSKIPTTPSCSPILGLWPRKDSSCNIFSWTRATFISWRQEISSRLWQWTHDKTFNSFPLKTLWDKCEDKCINNVGRQGFSLILHKFQNPFFHPKPRGISKPLLLIWVVKEENVYYTVFSRDFASGITAIWAQYLLKNYHMHGPGIAPSPMHLKIFLVSQIKLPRDGEWRLCTTQPIVTSQLL